jgi:hypothetical protein
MQKNKEILAGLSLMSQLKHNLSTVDASTSNSRASDMLDRARQKSIELQAKLSTLVVQSDKLHKVLQVDEPQTLYVVEGVGLHIKVDLRDRKPPCIVNFDFKNQTDHRLLKAYYSADSRNPRERGMLADKVSPLHNCYSQNVLCTKEKVQTLDNLQRTKLTGCIYL